MSFNFHILGNGDTTRLDPSPLTGAPLSACIRVRATNRMAATLRCFRNDRRRPTRAMSVDVKWMRFLTFLTCALAG